MQDWTPVAVLPNLHARHAVEGEFVAFAPIQDARVQAYCGTRPKFADFISRFTDAFEKPLQPLIYIVRNDAIPKLTNNSALMAFRDLVAACAVTRARTLNFVYPNRFGASYSNYFWLHPWMQNDTNDHLTAHTPALLAFHVVEKFHGQSSPELSEMELDEIDEPLFKEMMRRWARHYLGKRQRWQDRALFRSLNMAFHASQIPAGVGPTMYDLGRIIALWVSAFEILAHPRVKKSGLFEVYLLFAKVSYLDSKLSHRKYVADNAGRKPVPRRSLPCWLYGKMYRARNKFLHGGPINDKALRPQGIRLFWLAPSLYRLALTGALGMKIIKPTKIKPGTNWLEEYAKTRMRINDPQSLTERALLRAIKP